MDQEFSINDTGALEVLDATEYNDEPLTLDQDDLNLLFDRLDELTR